MSNIHERARGRWMEIWTQLFGIDIKVLDGTHHACPGCGGVDRFRINRQKLEHGVWFDGSEAKGGLDLCMHVSGLDFRQAVERIEELVGKDDAPRERRQLTAAEKALQRAAPLRRSKYLESRGITQIPQGLLGILDLEYWDGNTMQGRYPAILAPLVRNQKIVTVQATYLQGGAKAPVRVPKKTLPGPYETIKGAAVRLGEWKPGEPLGFAEGVETAISASILHGHAVWATLSTNGMETVDIPSGLDRAIIYGDNDENFAGHAASWRLAHRLKLAGVEVDVRFPNVSGSDWNDVLLERENGSFE